jgi:hypothetical protein
MSLSDEQKQRLSQILKEKFDGDQVDTYLRTALPVAYDRLAPTDSYERRREVLVDEAAKNEATLARLLIFILESTSDTEVRDRDAAWARPALRDALRPNAAPKKFNQQSPIIIVSSVPGNASAHELKAQLTAASLDKTVEIISEIGEKKEEFGNMVTRLATSALIVECIDEAGSERLQRELFAAMLAVTANLVPFRMAVPPGHPGDFNCNNDELDFRDETKSSMALRIVRQLIRLPEPRSAPAMPGNGPDWRDFAKDAARKGIVVCVGTELPDAQVDILPRDSMVSADLLAELGLVRYRRQLHRVPLMSAALAALVNRMATADDPVDWKKELACKLRQRSGSVASYLALGTMLQALKTAKNVDEMPLWVVTTNIDLGLERAFIETGLGFTVVVCSPDNGSAMAVSFPQVTTADDGRLVLGEHEEPSIPDGSATYRDVKEAYERDIGLAALPFPEYLARWVRNDLIAKVYEDEGLKSIHPGGLKDLAQPVLIKILGSCHEGGTFCIAADELPAWRGGNFLQVVRGLAGKHSVLLMGYSLTDPAFLFLYETLFAGADPSKANRPLALVQRAGQASDARGRIILKLLEGDRLVPSGRELGAKIAVVDDLGQALATLGAEIAERRPLDTS